MSNTVFILGAGASKQAGAPLMKDFLDTAHALWKTGKVGESEQRERVEVKARAVLAAREKFMEVGQAFQPAGAGDIPVPSSSLKSRTGKSGKPADRNVCPTRTATLADLYDPLTMPPDLLKAHSDLDRAVEKCYRPEPFHSDRERVEFLFSLYEKLTAPLLPATPKAKGRRSQNAATESKPRKQRTPGLPGQRE
jgi:hypothetical protein